MANAGALEQGQAILINLYLFIRQIIQTFLRCTNEDNLVGAFFPSK